MLAIVYLGKNSLSYELKVYVFYTSHPMYLTPRFPQTFKIKKKKVIKEHDALAACR